MDDINDFETARLLFDASRLSFRNVAGPFRCMGKLSFRPRSYQIVPLVMALRQPLTRLLIATDCLSEGINLQDQFNAVMHYDLPWNPNRSVMDAVLREILIEPEKAREATQTTINFGEEYYDAHLTSGLANGFLGHPFTPNQGKYIKTLPLHHTQQIIADNNKELRIRLRANA